VRIFEKFLTLVSRKNYLNFTAEQEMIDPFFHTFGHCWQQLAWIFPIHQQAKNSSHS